MVFDLVVVMVLVALVAVCEAALLGAHWALGHVREKFGGKK